MKEKCRIWKAKKENGAVIDCIHILFCGKLSVVTGQTIDQVKFDLEQDGRLVEVEQEPLI
ncbi:hypothetical protein KAR91_12325 [Candidatus Pacearchaeota archaeon]|nr:hypothetical protein [Candidatus Pacearchaeota archaeon]